MAEDRYVRVAPARPGGKISIRLDPERSEEENDRWNHTEGFYTGVSHRDIKILGLRLK